MTNTHQMSTFKYITYIYHIFIKNLLKSIDNGIIPLKCVSYMIQHKLVPFHLSPGSDRPGAPALIFTTHSQFVFIFHFRWNSRDKLNKQFSNRLEKKCRIYKIRMSISFQQSSSQLSNILVKLDF